MIGGLALLNKTVVTENPYTLELCKVKIAGWRCGIWKNNWTILGSDLKICHLFTQSFKHTFIQHLVGTRWVPGAELCTEETGMSKIYIR